MKSVVQIKAAVLTAVFVAALAMRVYAQTAEAVVSVQLPAAPTKHFVWEVKKGPNAIYLVGSVHLLKESVYPLPPVYDSTFSLCSRLILEMNLDSLDLTSVTTVLMQKGMYPDERTLASVLPEETYALAKAKLKEFGYDIMVLNKFRPWFIMLTVSTLEMQKQGFDAKFGLDMHYYNKAVEKKMKVSGLESLYDQIRVFESISDSAQAVVLLQSLKEETPEKSDLNSVLENWRTGNAENVEAFIHDELRSTPEAFDALLVRRNKNWLPQIEALLAEGTRAFVVVGAGHLVGEHGLIQMLKEKGYIVTQL